MGDLRRRPAAPAQRRRTRRRRDGDDAAPGARPVRRPGAGDRARSIPSRSRPTETLPATTLPATTAGYTAGTDTAGTDTAGTETAYVTDTADGPGVLPGYVDLTIPSSAASCATSATTPCARCWPGSRRTATGPRT